MSVDCQALERAGMDVEDALARVLGKPALLERLLAAFRADTSYPELCAACEEGDLDAIAAAAHSLKGVSANLSMRSLLEPTVRCLIAARAGDVERARQELPDISRAYEALVVAIG